MPEAQLERMTPESGRNHRPMRRIQRIHFVGIGGAGMSGIAEVLLTQGYRVSGSDQYESASTRRLADLGARVFVGHDARHVSDVDVVVVSTAVPGENPEVQAAHERRVPVVPRAEMLGELMRRRHGIAVAGTHGKTTTTCMVTEILRAAGSDPTFVVGGRVNSALTNARLGAGDFIVVEADESDASFLYLQPMVAVITNIDRDHMSTYGGDFERLKDTFIEFTHRLPFYGIAIICADDVHARSIVPRMTRPVLTYGVSDDADYRAVDIQIKGLTSKFRALRPRDISALDVTLNLPGRHNVLNALAAIAVATDEGVADSAILAGLAQYAGVGRRFEVANDIVIGDVAVTTVDDYGHHPTEVRAVIETARAVWPASRIVMVYQLHRFTRTRDLFDEFVAVLSEVDLLLLLDVYSAGETAIPGADAHAMAASIRSRGKVNPLFCATLEEVPDLLKAVVRTGDIVVTQGAGNVATISHRLRGINE